MGKKLKINEKSKARIQQKGYKKVKTNTIYILIKLTVNIKNIKFVTYP